MPVQMIPSTTAGYGLPPTPPLPPPGERFGKVFTPNEDGEYDPEQLDIMERLLAMYRPQYVPPQFAQPMTQIQPVTQITPTPYGFPSTTANVQVFPSGYSYLSPEARQREIMMPPPYPRALPPPPPPSGRIMTEEPPEE